MPGKAENERELKESLGDEIWTMLRDAGLGKLIERAVGGVGAGVIMALVSLARSHFKGMRKLALDEIRSRYGDQNIELLNQQVAGTLSPEDCWEFVHRFGGTIWVQNVYVTNEEGLSLVVFWHPDPQFKVEKGFVRIYRGVTTCGLDFAAGPSIGAAPKR